MKSMGKRKGSLVVLAVLCIVLLMLSTDLSAAQVTPKGKVTLAVSSLGAERLDYSQPSGNTNVVLSLVLNRDLIERGYEGEYVPGNATSWKMSPDGKTWDLVLRKGVKWHNGDTLTAQDLIYGVERMRRPEIASGSHWGPASFLDNLERVEIVDDHHVKYHFKKPFPLFPYWVNVAPPMPKKYLEKVGDKEFNDKPVGTGPFKFISRVRGSQYEFEAFEQFSGKVPSFKTLVIKIIPENATKIAALKTGEIDIASDIQGNLLTEIKNTPGLHLATVQGQGGGGGGYLVFAHRTEKDSPWADLRVRKAVALAIDRQKICDTVFRGQASPAVFPDAPSAVGIPKDMKPWPYDPEKAKALLAEAGYPNGLPGVWDLQTAPSGSSPFQAETAEAVAGYLDKVGIKTKVQVMEMGGFGAAYRSEKLKGLPLSGTGPMFDVGLKNMVWAADGEGWSWMRDEDTGTLWEKQLITANPAERRKILEKAVTILIDDVRIVPIIESKPILGLGSRIKEFRIKRGSIWATDGINNLLMAK
jgi:peptide/nickel transport system substrate-binding protein